MKNNTNLAYCPLSNIEEVDKAWQDLKANRNNGQKREALRVALLKGRQ